MNRRKLIGGIGLLVAAPAIVKISNIMPVKAWDVNEFTIDLRLTNGIHPVFTSHHYVRVNRDGLGIIDMPPGTLHLKPGDRVEMVVHDPMSRPVFRSDMRMGGTMFRPTQIQKTPSGGWDLIETIPAGKWSFAD